MRDPKQKQIKGIVADVPKPTAMTPDECRRACKKAGLEYLPGYESRVLRYVITNESQDRYGDVVRVAGAKLDNYLKNPVVMMAHRHDMPPIGKTVDLACDKQSKQIVASGLFLDGRTDMTGVSDTAFKLAQSGAMPGCSIGFMPVKANRPQSAEERTKLGVGENGYEFLEWELLEWSVCSIPANPDALQLNALLKCIAEKTIDVDARDLFVLDRFKMLTTRQCLDVYVKVFGGIAIKTDETTVDEGQAPIADIVNAPAAGEENGVDIDEPSEGDAVVRGVIPYAEHSKDPEGDAWDGAAETKNATPADLKVMCTWYDSAKPDVKSSYKLPHHRANGYHAVWKGVAAAMSALLGGRGGVDIPEGDIKGCYAHLVKHYEAFGKEPPEMKSIIGPDAKTVIDKIWVDVEKILARVDGEEAYTEYSKTASKPKAFADKIDKLLEAISKIDKNFQELGARLDALSAVTPPNNAGDRSAKDTESLYRKVFG